MGADQRSDGHWFKPSRRSHQPPSGGFFVIQEVGVRV